MLLAKLKDKLFNNRNSVEVESLEGDIDINDISLKELTDWVKSLREYIFYDTDADVIVVDFGTLFTDYVMFTGGLAHLTDEDGNHLFPTGKVPNIWTSSSTFDHIGDIDFDKVKDGDIIFARDESVTAVYSGVVEGYDADNSFRIKVLYSSKVSFYYYQKQDDYWDYVSTSDSPLGTKLYRYDIEVSSPSELQLYIIATEKLPQNAQLGALLDLLYEHGSLINICGKQSESQMLYDYDRTKLYYYNTSSSQFVVIDATSDAIIDWNVIEL